MLKADNYILNTNKNILKTDRKLLKSNINETNDS